MQYYGQPMLCLYAQLPVGHGDMDFNSDHAMQGEEAKLGVGSYSMVWKGCDRRTRKDWWVAFVHGSNLAFATTANPPQLTMQGIHIIGEIEDRGQIVTRLTTAPMSMHH
jgi:hypothetical protein